RVSCQRPVVPAFFLMFCHTVFNVVVGRVGSRCLDLPKGNRYHSGLVIPKRRVYQRAWSRSAGNRTEFSGIVRPSPASVLDLPTVRNCFSKSTWCQASVF